MCTPTQLKVSLTEKLGRTEKEEGDGMAGMEKQEELLLHPGTAVYG